MRVPIASMVIMAPRMSISDNSTGIAVISFDFSAVATWASVRPNSLAQTLTECKAPDSGGGRGSPQRLAVNGQRRSLHARGFRGGGTQRRQPHREAGLKGIGLQCHQNTPEDIVLRNAMREVQ